MSSLVLSGDTSGSITLSAPAVSGTTTITLPTVSGGNFVVSDSSGNVGIGTSSPSYKLDVVGGINSSSNISTASGNFVLGTNDTYLGFASNNIKFNNTSDRITLNTGAAERMRIDSSGNVLVGKTSASSSSLGFEARPTGEVNTGSSASANTTTVWNTYSTGAAAYRFYVGMGGTVYATSTTISAISDQRFKENIQDLDVGLDAVMSLKPRKFDWKECKGKDIKGDRGFIAQEFEQVFPDLIDEWKDPAPEGEEPYKSVRQDLIPVLVKAIQEQQTIIQDLKARIETLESK